MSEAARRGGRTWVLPAGIEVPGEETLPLGGLELRRIVGDGAWIAGLADRLQAAGESLGSRSAAEIAAALGAAGERFLDPSDPIREKALARLPPTSGLSEPMAEVVLDGMARDWTEERLLELLTAEFGSPSALDGFGSSERGRRSMPVGPRLCLQVVSGSVPGVGAHALLRSLLVKAPTLLKPGLGDVVLPVLLAEAIAEHDPGLAEALAVVYWAGGSTEVEDAALSRASLVTAYGSDASVGELRARTPVSTRFVAYHHRWSLGVIGRAALARDSVPRVAADVARSVAVFDQRGCVSPQALLVERGGDVAPRDFAAALAEAFGELELELPRGALDPTEASALQQLRGTAELMVASGGDVQLWEGEGTSWTVIYDPEDRLGETCVGRVARVVSVPEAAGVVEKVRGLGDHLQTIGHAGLEPGDAEALAFALGRAGATRFTLFSEVAFPPPWWHHDGGGPLRDLVRFVDLEQS